MISCSLGEISKFRQKASNVNESPGVNRTMEDRPYTGYKQVKNSSGEKKEDE